MEHLLLARHTSGPGLDDVQTRRLCSLSSPLALQADPGDDSLEKWTKQEGVMMLTVPEELKPASQLNGWRDPIIFDTPETSDTGCTCPQHLSLLTSMQACSQHLSLQTQGVPAGGR